MVYLNICVVLMYTLLEYSGSDKTTGNVLDELGFNELNTNHEKEARKILRETFNPNTTLMYEMKSLHRSLSDFRSTVLLQIQRGLDVELEDDLKVTLSDLAVLVHRIAISNQVLCESFKFNDEQRSQFNYLLEKCNNMISDLKKIL
uniref:Uncharacterized protein n=1 Tax=Homalodisca liturata TaxID=320908 RepID=A0A1B6HTS9_9HEMI